MRFASHRSRLLSMLHANERWVLPGYFRDVEGMIRWLDEVFKPVPTTGIRSLEQIA